ncbi:MAG: ComEC/Rec2 family competence protein [Parcubacteria group bacterium]|nr:ComEC/Rec2 family competence protein [Parcubacteria group bacterium]
MFSLSYSQQFFLYGLSYLAGIALFTADHLLNRWQSCMVFLILCAWFVFLRYPRWSIAVAVLFFASAGVRVAFLKTADASLTPFFESEVELVGVVAKEVKHDLSMQKIFLDLEYLRSDGKRHAVSSRLIVKVPLYPEYAYGDRLALTCKLKNVLGDEHFSFRKYLQKQESFAQCHRPKVVMLETKQGNLVLHNLLTFKSRMLFMLEKLYPEPYAGFLEGLIFGVEGRMDAGRIEDIRGSGLMHVIVISGMHVILIIEALQKCLFFIARKTRTPLIIGFLFVFLCFVGFSASAFRGVVMGICVLIAETCGRKRSAKNVMVFTAFVMLSLAPLDLWFDLGFQLSFLATAGILFILPHLKQTFDAYPDIFGIKEAALTTLSASMGVIPILAFAFHTFTPGSLISNIMVAFCVTPMMFLGCISIVMGIVSLPIGMAVGYANHFLMDYFFWVAKRIAHVPYAVMEVPHFGFFTLVILYAIIFLVMKKFHNQKHSLYAI